MTFTEVRPRRFDNGCQANGIIFDETLLTENALSPIVARKQTSLRSKPSDVTQKLDEPFASIDRGIVLPERRINDLIRYSVHKAAEKEATLSPFVLKGRGHEPRVSLCVRMAGILRGQDLPRIRIDGYGPNNFYPARIFARARKSLMQQLGWSPFEFYDGTVDPSVYRVNRPNSVEKKS